ncbi:UNVERIFIED_CONTAM: hypothetical protein GTU68_024413, partial [Idotea baltica]|nr:hypothetical protein [Idotea baltica]
SGSGGGEDGIGRGGGGEERRGGGAVYTISGDGNVKCTLRQVIDESGACVDATVSKTIFLYESPFPDYEEDLPAPKVPKPKLDVNYVFVRTPQQPPAPDPVVVPPPQQRTLVYVLTKNGQKEQQVIEVPTRPGQPPDVFYVNYNEGDNPLLAGGLTLREVLAHKRRQGQVIRGGSSGGGLGRPRNAGTRRPHAASPAQYSH